MKEMTAEQFLKDVSTHTMTVLLDNGLYRHLKFKAAKDSWNLWFEVVTWPNSLTIDGDMGTWSFSRIEDMFEFFGRGQRDGTLKINEGYWGEKITSESRFGGPHKKHVPEVFEQRVIASLDGYGLSDQFKAEVIEFLSDEISWNDDEGTVRRQLEEVSYEGPEDKFEFQDIWEISGEAYTYHFLWCCYAIVWAIQQYDLAAKEKETVSK